MESTYYDLLGVPENATTKEIRKAALALLAEYHPDKNVGAKQKVLDLAAEKTREIYEARDVLENSTKRKAYDGLIAQQRASEAARQKYQAASAPPRTARPTPPPPPPPQPAPTPQSTQASPTQAPSPTASAQSTQASPAPTPAKMSESSKMWLFGCLVFLILVATASFSQHDADAEKKAAIATKELEKIPYPAGVIPSREQPPTAKTKTGREYFAEFKAQNKLQPTDSMVCFDQHDNLPRFVIVRLGGVAENNRLFARGYYADTKKEIPQVEYISEGTTKWVRTYAERLNGTVFQKIDHLEINWKTMPIEFHSYSDIFQSSKGHVDTYGTCEWISHDPSAALEARPVPSASVKTTEDVRVQVATENKMTAREYFVQLKAEKKIRTTDTLVCFNHWDDPYLIILSQSKDSLYERIYWLSESIEQDPQSTRYNFPSVEKDNRLWVRFHTVTENGTTFGKMDSYRIWTAPTPHYLMRSMTLSPAGKQSESDAILYGKCERIHLDPLDKIFSKNFGKN